MRGLSHHSEAMVWQEAASMAREIMNVVFPQLSQLAGPGVPGMDGDLPTTRPRCLASTSTPVLMTLGWLVALGGCDVRRFGD